MTTEPKVAEGSGIMTKLATNRNIERNAYSRIAAEFEIAKRKCKSQSEVDSLWDSVYGPMVDRAMDAAENMFCLT